MKIGETFVGLLFLMITMSSLCCAGGAATGSVESRAKALTQQQREGIVEAANKALKVARKKDAPDEYELNQLDDAIAQLKPIRVRNDFINVAIVLAEKDGVEEGIYVAVLISSHAPTLDRFARLDNLTTKNDRSFGTLYYYQLKSKKR